MEKRIPQAIHHQIVLALRTAAAFNEAILCSSLLYMIPQLRLDAGLIIGLWWGAQRFNYTDTQRNSKRLERNKKYE